MNSPSVRKTYATAANNSVLICIHQKLQVTTTHSSIKYFEISLHNDRHTTLSFLLNIYN